jgi:hypothetical protein
MFTHIQPPRVLRPRVQSHDSGTVTAVYEPASRCLVITVVDRRVGDGIWREASVPDAFLHFLPLWNEFGPIKVFIPEWDVRGCVYQDPPPGYRQAVGPPQPIEAVLICYRGTYKQFPGPDFCMNPFDGFTVHPIAFRREIRCRVVWICNPATAFSCNLKVHCFQCEPSTDWHQPFGPAEFALTDTPHDPVRASVHAVNNTIQIVEQTLPTRPDPPGLDRPSLVLRDCFVSCAIAHAFGGLVMLTPSALPYGIAIQRVNLITRPHTTGEWSLIWVPHTADMRLRVLAHHVGTNEYPTNQPVPP